MFHFSSVLFSLLRIPAGFVTAVYDRSAVAKHSYPRLHHLYSYKARHLVSGIFGIWTISSMRLIKGNTSLRRPSRLREPRSRFLNRAVHIARITVSEVSSLECHGVFREILPHKSRFQRITAFPTGSRIFLELFEVQGKHIGFVGNNDIICFVCVFHLLHGGKQDAFCVLLSL